MTFKRQIFDHMIDAMQRAGYGDGVAHLALEKPRHSEHGDIATPVALSLARQFRKNPLQIAEDIGLDMARLKKDMESQVVTAYIAETVKLGEALKFQGTPTFVINGAVIGGAVPKEVLVAVIAAARAGALPPGELTEQDMGLIVQKFGS